MKQLLILAFFLAVATQTWGQKEDDPAARREDANTYDGSGKNMYRNRIVIHNGSNERLKVVLFYKDNSRQDMVLRAGARLPARRNEECRYVITLNDAQHSCTDVLKPSTAYEVVWDSEKERFCLKAGR